jgi:hypothetical protein
MLKNIASYYSTVTESGRQYGLELLLVHRGHATPHFRISNADGSPGDLH